MDEPLRIVAALATGFATVTLAVPVAERVAARTNFYDRPGGYKEHGRPTPYLGGAAVVLGFIVAAVAFADSLADFRVPTICALILLAVGTIDDRVNLGIIPRLIVEIGVGVAVWAAGQGWETGSGGVLDLLLTVGWVVGVINAFNLMDNLDGAAATVAGTSAAGVGAVATLQGSPILVAICFALSGACAGFLPHNLARPSRIFLGDGGSMPIGFILAAAIMVLPQSHPGLPAFAIACLLVGVPLLDMAAVIVSRRRRGVGVFTGGRDHLTHRLYGYLGSERMVAAVLAASQGFFCLVAVLLSQGVSGAAIIATSTVVIGAAAIGFASIELIGSGLRRVRQDDG